MFQFSDIAGQDEIKNSLTRQIQSGKLHHAHLFVGKMGYGSFKLAIAFVKYLYCKNRGDQDSCGQCNNCLKVETLTHVDIHYTIPSFKKDYPSQKLMPDFRSLAEEREGIFDLKDWTDFNNEKNAKIRSLECDVILKNMGLSSYEDGYKTQVIWMAESLEKESNKILKILEEPSPKTIFILVAESSERLLPTILSRCNIHKITPLRAKDIQDLLSQKCNNKKNIEEAVSFADGDLLEALRHFEDELSDFPLEANLLEFLRGLINFHERKFSNIIRAIHQSEKIANQSRSVQKKFLEYFLYFIRQVALIKAFNTSNLSPSLQQAARHFASLLDLDQINYWSQIVDKYYIAIEGNANVKISFVSLTIECGKIQVRDEFEVSVNK